MAGRKGAARAIRTKKATLLEMLASGPVPLEAAARALYGDGGELAQFSVIRLLNAYRAKDPEFRHIRVRGKAIRRLA